MLAYIVVRNPITGRIEGFQNEKGRDYPIAFENREKAREYIEEYDNADPSKNSPNCYRFRDIMEVVEL